MAQRQDVHVGPEANALGTCRHLHQDEERVEQRRGRVDRRHAFRSVRVAAANLGRKDEMLGNPDRLEAELLGAHRDRRHILRAEHEERDTDLECGHVPNLLICGFIDLLIGREQQAAWAFPAHSTNQ
jgi:hypothetical protein